LRKISLSRPGHADIFVDQYKEAKLSTRTLSDGYVWLVLGLLCTSITSLLDHFAGAGRAANLARGVFDGLAIVAFGTAIFLMVYKARQSDDRS
jgi:hypothetical protein